MEHDDVQLLAAVGRRIDFEAVGLTRGDLQDLLDTVDPFVRMGGRVSDDVVELTMTADPNLSRYALMDMLTLMDAYGVDVWSQDLEDETQAEFRKMPTDQIRRSAPPWIMEQFAERARIKVGYPNIADQASRQAMIFDLQKLHVVDGTAELIDQIRAKVRVLAEADNESLREPDDSQLDPVDLSSGERHHKRFWQRRR